MQISHILLLLSEVPSNIYSFSRPVNKKKKKKKKKNTPHPHSNFLFPFFLFNKRKFLQIIFSCNGWNSECRKSLQSWSACVKEAAFLFLSKSITLLSKYCLKLWLLVSLQFLWEKYSVKMWPCKQQFQFIEQKALNAFLHVHLMASQLTPALAISRGEKRFPLAILWLGETSGLCTRFSKVCFLCNTYRIGQSSRDLFLSSSEEGTLGISSAFYHPKYRSHQ